MNTLSRELGVTTTAGIGLLSIEFTCFDGDQCYTQALCLTNMAIILALLGIPDPVTGKKVLRSEE